MADDTLSDYEQALQRAREQGLVDGADDDRRQHPRLRAKSGAVRITFDPDMEISDVSASGIAFVSGQDYRVGQRLQISVGEYYGVPAEVVGSDEVPPKRKKDPTRYRIRCKFADEFLGRFAVVQLLNKQLD